MTNIICISGQAGAGKDTAARILRTLLSEGGRSADKTLIAHNADLLKYICEKFFAWNGLKDEAGRDLLQHVGTDVVRAKDPDFWVNFLVNILRLFPDRWDFLIVPDTRYPNEIERFKAASHPTVHVHIERPGLVSALTQEQREHSSETALADTVPDVIVCNDGEVADLPAKLIERLPQIIMTLHRRATIHNEGEPNADNGTESEQAKT